MPRRRYPQILPAWFRGMEPDAKNALCAAFLSYASASMIMHMLEFVFILQTAHVPEACSAHREDVAANIFSGVLLASAFGGGFFGLLSDRIGRAETLRITVVWTTVSMCACGWAWALKWDSPALRHLLELMYLGPFWDCTPLGLTCVIMGFGFGGVWPAGAILVGEWATPAHRGLRVGIMQCGWAFGGLIAVLVKWRLLKAFEGDEVIRWMFWVGLAPGVLAFFFVRRPLVDDAPVFRPVPPAGTMRIVLAILRWTFGVALVVSLMLRFVVLRPFRAVPPSGMTMDSFAILRTACAKIVNFFTNFRENAAVIRAWFINFLAILRTACASVANFFMNFRKNAAVILTWSITRLATCGLSMGAMAGYYAITLRLLPGLQNGNGALTDGNLLIFIAGSFVGYPAGGWASDRFGRRRTFITSALGSIAFTVGISLLQLAGHWRADDAWGRPLTFCLGFFSSSVFSGMGAFFTELYPTLTRGRDAGSSYSFGRKFAYSFNAFLQQGLSSFLFVFIIIAYACVVLAARWLPEERGLVLTPRPE